MELIVDTQAVLSAGNGLQPAREMHDALVLLQDRRMLPDIANQVT